MIWSVVVPERNESLRLRGRPKITDLIRIINNKIKAKGRGADSHR